MTKPDSLPANVAALPFEQALEELEGIVRRLERGDVPLEDSIAIYERGEALKTHCEALLKRAEARIEKITIGPDGRRRRDPARRGTLSRAWGGPCGGKASPLRRVRASNSIHRGCS